jgi:hypothetical protein
VTAMAVDQDATQAHLAHLAKGNLHLPAIGVRRAGACSRPCLHLLMWLFFPDQLAAFAFEDPEEAGWLWVPNALYNPCRAVALGTSDGILS